MAVGEIGEGAFDDFVANARGLAEEDGGELLLGTVSMYMG